MLGYWNDTEATSETIRNGWLHTGDLAAIDPDGHIRIVGRLKDLIVNSGGDNIAPAPIEQELSLYPEVEQVVVVGDGRPWLSAIISLSADIDPSQGDEILYSILKRYNADKSPLVQVRKAVLMKEPCSIDNGLLTPTQKVKRAQVIQMYKESIDHLYRRSSS
jgi:long-chain acyl-CoA synthetase